MHIHKLAKLAIGVNNIVVENVDYDEEEPKIIIDARPTKWHECECGRCGHAAKHYDGKGKTRMWRCLDVASIKCFVRSQAIRVKCPPLRSGNKKGASGLNMAAGIHSPSNKHAQGSS